MKKLNIGHALENLILLVFGLDAYNRKIVKLRGEHGALHVTSETDAWNKVALQASVQSIPRKILKLNLDNSSFQYVLSDHDLRSKLVVHVSKENEKWNELALANRD